MDGARRRCILFTYLLFPAALFGWLGIFLWAAAIGTWVFAGATVALDNLAHVQYPRRMPRAAAISTQGLSKSFGETLAVDSVDLEVAEGSIFGLLGPNGAGKTTTIRMLTGILSPSMGQATVLGYDLRRQAESVKRNIGYVAQHFGLYENLSCAENLQFYARVYGKADDQVLDELLHRYRFTKYRSVLARELSGGLRQRLALICALTHSPQLLFLDEPTAGVDPAVRKELWDFFYELAHSGTTLFVTTHYMEEAERCDRLAFIQNGRLIASDTPEGIRGLLKDQEVLVLNRRYDPALVRRAGGLSGITVVNQVGGTLRLLSSAGRYDENSITAALGLSIDAGTIVTHDRPSIEDVFIALTRDHDEDESAEH